MMSKRIGARFPRGMKLFRPVTSIVGAVVVAAGLTVALVGFTTAAPRAAAAAAQSPPTCAPGTTVNTNDGPVCAVTANGVTSYLGIPYAAPPVGKLRWAPPAPAIPWTTTLQATTSGNICPAPGGSGTPVGNENCLNLNVQVPAGTTARSNLPVMVEIHGGGFLSTAFNTVGDGTHMVTSGHVAWVAINYRLGILGFMALDGLGPHAGDYGLQDQEAALRWVQQNIVRFGGNPHNVTILGQSAGGASVCLLTASPPARGLFAKGISESGFYNAAIGPQLVWEAADCKAQLPTEAQAQADGAAFAAKVGCGTTANQVACLRAVPVATLLKDAGGQISGSTAGGTIAPTINGTTLPMSPGKAFATGHVNNVSLMIGVSRDEINGGDSSPPAAAATAAQYRALVEQKYGPLAPAVFRLYPPSRFPGSSPFIAFRTIVADSDSVCPALAADQQLARRIPVYAYEDDDADTPNFYLNPAFPNGAFHVAEGAFVLPVAGLTFDADQSALAAQVTGEWTGYARTGDPTVAGTPLWTRYTSRNPMVMSLVPAGDSALDPASTIAMQHNCGFWDAVTPVPSH
ncbi:MAG: carboxylesterase/lipase family protein [Streptosporangiaceae bacterium]